MTTATRRRRPQPVEETPPEPAARNVQIQYRDISSLTAYEFNPRDNIPAIESVAESIQNFGFLVPVVVDADGVIVAGHTRVEAARNLGLESIPVVEVNWLSEDQVRAFRIIDNKVAELAAWDNDLLAQEISALADSGISFTSMGFTQQEIDCLSDVVAEDCLSVGASAQLTPTVDHDSDTRTPSATRLVLGDICLFTTSSVFRRWSSDLRMEMDFDEAAIAQRIKDLLGITPYEREEEGTNQE